MGIYIESAWEQPDDAPRTGPQVAGSSGTSNAELGNLYSRHYRDYLMMRYDPTIAFGRMLCVAPLVCAGWSYEEADNAPPGARDFIEDQLEPWRVMLVKTAMEGYVDFGFAPYEIVSRPDETGMICLKKIKPLLQEKTHILIDIKTGEFIGLRQQPQGFASDNKPVDLSIYDCLNIAIDVRGTDWYGQPLLENIRSTWQEWNDTNNAAKRYDAKMAGSHWVVHYPVGYSPYQGEDRVSNFEIAKRMLASMKASGEMAVPIMPVHHTADTKLSEPNNQPQWKIELLTDQGKGVTTFIERQKYLDTLKIRGLGFPERAVLEGQFGTKAESEAQADFAIFNFEMRHQVLVRPVNHMVVDTLLDINYGCEAKCCVYIKPSPLIDSTKIMLRNMYLAFLKDPQTIMNEVAAVDMQSLRKTLGLPEAAIEESGMGLLSEYFNQSQQGLLGEYFNTDMPDPNAASAPA